MARKIALTARCSALGESVQKIPLNEVQNYRVEVVGATEESAGGTVGPGGAGGRMFTLECVLDGLDEGGGDVAYGRGQIPNFS